VINLNEGYASWTNLTGNIMLDNIIVGNLVEGLTPRDLGIGKEETTVTMTMQEAIEMGLFLPRLLVHFGLFKTTSEVKRIDKDRKKSTKIKDKNSRELWRTLDNPEMTHFKIGKKNFWLIVGES